METRLRQGNPRPLFSQSAAATGGFAKRIRVELDYRVNRLGTSTFHLAVCLTHIPGIIYTKI